MAADDFLRARLAYYVRLRGGYTFPLAGAIYWGALGFAGTMLPLKTWILAAFVGSGLIFPLALGLSRLARVDVMGAPGPAGTVIGPALILMLLFWPMAILAFWTTPALAPPILAIGMSLHWPVIGWSYGRPALYTAHAIARAAIVTALWLAQREAQLVAIPAAVAFVYLLTVVCIFVDVRQVRRALAR